MRAYELWVIAEGGVQFQESNRLTLLTKNASIFIQMDKAMYKPGQTGKAASRTEESKDDVVIISGSACNSLDPERFEWNLNE